MPIRVKKENITSKSYYNGKDSNNNQRKPYLHQKVLADGRQSLYLEYYMGYNKVVDEQQAKIGLSTLEIKSI